MSVAKKLAKKPIDEKLLKKLIPFNTLSADRLRELAEKADIEQASASRVLFKHGDLTDRTYYLLSGAVEVQLPSGQNFLIKADTPAALHPLADARPRRATAVIKSTATLLRIDTGLLDILLQDGRARGYEVNEIHTEDENDWMTRFLQSLSVMNIPVKNIENLIARMEEQRVHAGETVIRQSEADPQHYFVLKQGRCVVTKLVASGKTPIRVAELNEGVGFGEEALLSHQPRNATVTMLTDGSIMRLTKPDFTGLIAEPAVQVVSYAQARDMVSAGATWIDTRNDNEQRQDSIIGSTHIPLAALRLRARELNSYGQYITVCDSGHRATAAAFLLRQMGLAAFALSKGMNDVPAAARHGAGGHHGSESAERTAVITLTATPNGGTASVTPPVGETLKPAALAAVTATENVRPMAQSAAALEATRALAQAQTELDTLRAKLHAAQDQEQELAQRLAQQQTGVAAELQGMAREQAQLKHRLAQAETARAQMVAQAETLRAELHETRTRAAAEAQRANSEVARYRDEVAAQKARLSNDALNLTSTEAAYESVQQELEGLRRDHERALRAQRSDDARLKAEIATKAADLKTMQQQLECEVEKKRAAEEALLAAQREATRLRAEADAARKRAEELIRRAHDSESEQSALRQEVLRKVEAAELMRLEAQEQAKQLSEAAEQSRKRAEDEARRAAEIETARQKSSEESERRARLTDEIRRKADEEIAGLKMEAEAARAHAAEAQKKSAAAEAARRKIEEEIKRQPRPMVPATKADAPAENELEHIEEELARLQEKLESKKRAAVTRQQDPTAKLAPNKKSGDPELQQNVYDIHQKTQKLPAFKPNESPPADLGKVRKSGWISDAILWETTIGLRDDAEAEKELGNVQEAVARYAESTPPAKPHIEPSTAALSSGELRLQEAKRSVFTTREAATTSTQRRVEAPQRANNTAVIFAALVAAALAVGATYVVMDKSGGATETDSSVVKKSAVNVAAPLHEAETPPSSATQLNSDAAKAKVEEASPLRNGGIQRKESALAEPVAKAKREPTKIAPAPKAVVESLPTSTAAEKHESTPSSRPSATPATPATPPAEAAPVTNAAEHTAAPHAAPAAIIDADEPAPSPATSAPMFTDKAQVN